MKYIFIREILCICITLPRKSSISKKKLLFFSINREKELSLSRDFQKYPEILSDILSAYLYWKGNQK